MSGSKVLVADIPALDPRWQSLETSLLFWFAHPCRADFECDEELYARAARVYLTPVNNFGYQMHFDNGRVYLRPEQQVEVADADLRSE